MRRALAALVAALMPVVPSTYRHQPAAPAMVKVIAVLRAQVDPGTVAGHSRRQRQTALVRALRARAAADQPGVLGLLRRREAQGLVAGATPLWVVNAIAVTATPSVVRELAARPEVREVQPDRSIPAPPASAAAAPAASAVPVEPNVDAVGAPAMWEMGLTGRGAVVAVMDTGVDATHPDLAASWRGGADSWFDPNGEHPSEPTDVNGHGTATTGVIVGGSAGGTSLGVAPGAQWIAVKIFNDRGVASSSAIHRGFQWLLDPDGNPATADAPDVVNDSWSGAAAGCNLDFQADLRNLRGAGILPVFSAGNYGDAAGTVLSPANNPEALAVGSIDGAGVVDPSSSRGPSACDQRVVPRLVAPGVGVHTTDLYGGYLDASGTSLAAPHVTGVLALLLGAFPDLGADRQQAALESTAGDLGPAGADNAYGYGRVNAPAAYRWIATSPDVTVSVSPSEASVVPGGAAAFTVSTAGVNGFAADVALSVAGLPAQASATISPAVVPGSAGAAQVAVATTSAVAPGTYPLTVTATGGGVTRAAAARLTVTPPEDYSVTVSPASVAVSRKATASYTVSTGAIGSFASPVTLSVTGKPAGSTATFTPDPVAVPGASTLRVATTSQTARGTFTLLVSGAAGAIEHHVAVTLVVR